MLKAKIFTLAALLVVLMSNVYVGRAQQTDFNPEVIWESQSPVTFNTLKFSPDDKYFYVRNDGGIYKFNAENGEYMGLFISGFFGDFVIVGEYGWIFCTRAEGLSIYDMNTGTFIKNIGDSWPGGWIDVSPDKSKIVFRQSGDMWVYSLPDLKEICRYPHSGSPRFIDNDRIAMTHGYLMYEEFVDSYYAIDIYSADNGKLIKSLSSPHAAQAGNTIYISPDQKYIISTGSSRVNFYDVETGELIKNIITNHKTFDISFSPLSDFYIISSNEVTSLYNNYNNELIASIDFNKYGSAKFLNKNTKQLLAYNKYLKIKMLYFDFDSLLTDVGSNELVQEIYPNPNNEYVIIPLEDINFSNVMITDINGKHFPAIFTLESNSKSEAIRLNLTDLTKGTYFVTIQYTHSIKTYKLIKGE